MLETALTYLAAFILGGGVAVYLTLRVQAAFAAAVDRRARELRKLERVQPTPNATAELAAAVENGELKGEGLRQLFAEGKARVINGRS